MNKIWIVVVLAFVGCSKPSEEHLFFRSIGGISNNVKNLSWGTARMALRRHAYPAYADGISLPSGISRPSSREISNQLFRQEKSIPNESRLTDWVWQWGQFIGHDISLTEPFANSAEPLNIAIPKGDAVFDPQGTGIKVMPFVRSIFHSVTGRSTSNPRQQINEVTSFIDASHIYGSDTIRDKTIRRKSNGELFSSQKANPDSDFSPYLISSNDTNQDGENLLPKNIFEASNCNYGNPPKNLFLAGDVRANEIPGLIALHTVFMREHNRQVEIFAKRFPKASSDVVFEYARKWVGALIQSITYQEFLPALLGPYAPGLGGEYYPNLDPSISNEFSTVFYRFGHSMIPSHLLKISKGSGAANQVERVKLSQSFFDPKMISRSSDVDAFLTGLSAQRAENVDLKITEDLRSVLFQGTQGHGLDLAALNIQRGRDHGIPDYNTLRTSMGLPRKTEFHHISKDEETVRILMSLYPSVDDVDPWVGALAEEHLEFSALGELMTIGLQETFVRLRDGDRFWFERDLLLSVEDLHEIRSTTLSHVIARNSGAKDLGTDLFRF